MAMKEWSHADPAAQLFRRRRPYAALHPGSELTGCLAAQPLQADPGARELPRHSPVRTQPWRDRADQCRRSAAPARPAHPDRRRERRAHRAKKSPTCDAGAYASVRRRRCATACCPRRCTGSTSTYPDIDLEVQEAGSRVLTRELAQGRLDVALLIVPLHHRRPRHRDDAGAARAARAREPCRLRPARADGRQRPTRPAAGDVPRGLLPARRHAAGLRGRRASSRGLRSRAAR